MEPAAGRGEIRIVPDLLALHRAAAEDVVRVVQETLRRRKVCTIALAGGDTPRGLYSLLAGDGDPSFRRQLPWPQLHFFFTDERPVNADHPRSNYRMARETLLSRVQLTRKQVHRIRTDGMTPPQAAREHERELREFFGDNLMLRHEIPRFDLVLLGLGADGHVAGLFPLAPLPDKRSLVAAPPAAGTENERITLTPRVFNMAAAALFLVSGSSKRAALEAALTAPFDAEHHPAHSIKLEDGTLTWLADAAAAG